MLVHAGYGMYVGDGVLHPRQGVMDGGDGVLHRGDGVVD